MDSYWYFVCTMYVIILCLGFKVGRDEGKRDSRNEKRG